MNVKNYGTVRCKDCDQDLTDKAQYYEYIKDTVLVRCCNCNWRVK